MSQLHPLAVVLVTVLLAGDVRAEDVSGVKGALLFAGGELRFDNRPVWERFVHLAGGRGAPVVVIPAAARDPMKSGQAAVENLNRYGLQATLVPIAPNLKDVDYKNAVRNPEYVETLRKAKGIWFIGGSQQRITQALLGKHGCKTLALEAIWEAYRGGAVLGGSSAGTAIMSRMMFGDAMNSLDTMKYGIRGTVEKGLGFIGDEWFVDQHFLTRGRFARALCAMHALGFRHGIGVDEDTAVVFKDGRFEVIGYKGALVLDLSEVQTDPELKPVFNIKKAKLTYLDTGDSMDSRTFKVTLGKLKAGGLKIDPHSEDFKPYYNRPEAYTDILGAGAIYDAMYHAVDSRVGKVKGLAFSLEGDQKNRGFEFTVYRDRDTLAWFTAGGGYETYTVLNAYVDINPVELAEPLYRPLKAPEFKHDSPVSNGP